MQISSEQKAKLNYAEYCEMILDNEPDKIAGELDRLMTKIMKLQNYYKSIGGGNLEVRKILHG